MRGERGFRFATGAFAVLLVATVAAIGAELARQSWLSIGRFGLRFWLTRTWDPVAGEFGALPFIYGTVVSSLIALLLAVPLSIGAAIYLTDLAPLWLRQPLASLIEMLRRGVITLT